MDIMEAWISATITQDLDQALGVAGSQPLGSLNGSCEDHESAIWVKASKSGVVQIIKRLNLIRLLNQWERYDEDFTAWLSDSTIRLKAIFTPKAAAQHKSKHGKRITFETVGNIIQLEDADIVASYVHEGPRTKKITLLINKFKLIGSDTSGQIGNSRPFDATSEFEELLRKLSAYRENTGHAHHAQQTPKKHSAAGPRLGTWIPDHYGSQQLYSQAPVRHDSGGAAAMADQQSLGGSRTPGWASNQNEKLAELLKAKKASKAITHPATDTTAPAATSPTSGQKYQVALTLSHKGEAEGAIAMPKPRDRVQKKANQKKIRSRDLRISKDQQDLLDSEDSWLPAKPGHRGPVANIPPAILEEIIQSMKAKAAKQKPGDQIRTARNSSEALIDPLVQEELEETAETQPEMLISSQDWPESSPDPGPRREPTRYELPPDSSPTTADDMNLQDDGEVQDDIGSPNEASSEYPNEQAQLPRSTPAGGRGNSYSKPVVTSIDSDDSDADGKGDTMAPRVDPSDSESELETSVLLKLGEQNMSSAGSLSTQEVPTTAIQPQEAVLQVKRTPYGVSDDDKPMYTNAQTYPASYRMSSPPKRRRMDDSGRARNVDGREDQTHTSSNRNHDLELTSQSAQIQSSGVDETRLAHITQQEAPWTQDSQKPPAAVVTPEFLVDSLGSQGEIEPIYEYPILSPYVSNKRRKLQNSSINFGFSQDEIPKEDPSVTARRYRDEYMARRKVSYSEGRNSPNNVGTERLSIPERDRNLLTMTLEQSDMPVDKGNKTLNTFEAAGNTSEDNTRPSRQLHQPDATSFESAASPDQVPEPLTAVNEPDSSPELESAVIAPSEKPTIANSEQPHSVPENPDVQSSMNSLSTKLEVIYSTEISLKSNGSRQAQSLPELMTPALSQTDLPDLPAVAQDLDADIYSQFKSVYPEYRGSEEDFLGMCRKIEQLSRCDRMEHKSLWDDFILRYQMDYPQYLERCLKNFEDPKTYERFYRDEVDEPKFNKRVLLPSTLAKALPPGPAPFVASECNFVENATTRRSSTAEQVAQRIQSLGTISRSSPVLGANDDELSSCEPKTTVEGDRKHLSEDQLEVFSVNRPTDQHHKPKAREMINTLLQSSFPTANSPAIQTRFTQKDFVSRSPRRIPWLQNTSTASEGTSNRETPGDHVPRKYLPERSLSAISPNKDIKTSVPGGIGTKYDKVVTYHPKTQGLEHSRPRLLPQSHKAMSRVAKNLNTPLGNVTSSDSGEPKLPQADSHEVDEGWKDHPTSLQGFTKFYQAIKPGRGNSWAQEEDCKNTQAEVKGGKTIGMRSMDIMSWHL
ncbi:MAG: hypothetical protein Q9226_002397 [Calogaya cf. arnoldii]